MALMLDIPLQTQETLMKYIRGLPVHIRNIVFMFGPTNLDEVSSFKLRILKQGKRCVRGIIVFKERGQEENRMARITNAVMRKEGNHLLQALQERGT